jgi:RNA polymerase sigma-70 factor (ECF subfamily)
MPQRSTRLRPSPAIGTCAPRLQPGARAALRELGVDPERQPGELSEEHQLRLETALMARFRDERSEGAFADLHAWCLPSVRRAVLGHLRQLPRGLEAAELVQDVFVNLFRYAASFRDERAASFRCWMGTIAANAVRRHLTGARRLSLELVSEEGGEPADQHAGPAQLALRGEEHRSLSLSWCLLLSHYAQAHAELAPRDRLALELVEVSGLSYTEACEHLGVGMSNMKMIMFRARRRLRARMQQAMAKALLPACRLAG